MTSDDVWQREMKGHLLPNLFFCRDVLALGNRLTKERDEMCKELKRLHESSMELHDNMIMEIQVLKEEINTIKKYEDLG